MSKYSLLYHHLLGVKQDYWKASFQEIENILGFSLPESARKYQAWWANQNFNSQSQSWQSAGWKTENLNLQNETIDFVRNGSAVLKKFDKPQKQTKKQNEEKTEYYAWDNAQVIDSRVCMRWRPLGALKLDKNGRLLFPSAEAVPALYRFQILFEGRLQSYVGETKNLTRRLGHYRNPGNNQVTNIRLNEILTGVLLKGAEVSISIVVEGAWIEKSEDRKPLDLSSKVVRCLLENLTILEGGTDDIDNLNKAKL